MSNIAAKNLLKKEYFEKKKTEKEIIKENVQSRYRNGY